MADAPYLVALALVEFAGKRALPLTGKSQSADAADAVDPGDDGRTLALELLLRLWQRSEEGPLQRAAGEASLLLVELPMELMSEQLPLLKANWIACRWPGPHLGTISSTGSVRHRSRSMLGAMCQPLLNPRRWTPAAITTPAIKW